MSSSTADHDSPRLESGWVLANHRFMAFHAVFLSGVLFFLFSLVRSNVLTGGDVLGFLMYELPLAALLAFIARHVVVAAHMMGHYLEARRQGVLAGEVRRRVAASGIEDDVGERPWKQLGWSARARRLRWYTMMFLRIPYGLYPGVDRTGNLFIPNLFVCTASPNIAVQAKGPQVGKRIADVALGLGVPLLVIGIFIADAWPETLRIGIRLLFMIGVIAALDVHRTDNDAYRKYRDRVGKGNPGPARAGKPSDCPQRRSLLARLLDPGSRMSAATMPIDAEGGSIQDSLLQPHQFRPILEGRGSGANVSMGQFGVVVLGGDERFAEIFVSALQDRVKILLQKTSGLTHLGLSSSGSERGTFTPGSLRVPEDGSEPDHALAEEEAIRVLVHAVREVGGILEGEGGLPGQPRVIVGIVPEADRLARAYRLRRRSTETGKYLFDLKEGEKLELDSDELRRLYRRWHDVYGVRLFINPFAADDLVGFWRLRQDLRDEAIIVSGNLVGTSASRIREIAERLTKTSPGQGPRALTELIDAVLLVPGQIGTVSEVVAAAREAERHGLAVMMGRSAAATTDPLEADLALGVGAFMDCFGGARNVEVLDKICRKRETVELFREGLAREQPDRATQEITVVDMKAYSRLTNARVPTLSVIVTLSDGDQFTVDAPVGHAATADTAPNLDVAAHLVDGDERHYDGRGVRGAIRNFDEVIAPMFLDKSIWSLPSLAAVDRQVLAAERRRAEAQDGGGVPLLRRYSAEQVAGGEASDRISDREVLARRREIGRALARKAGLGMQPLAAASVAAARILARAQGKDVVQLVREVLRQGIDDDYLYGFTDERPTSHHLQGHWILANHNFMSFHMAFLTGVVFFLRSLVSEGAVAAGEVHHFLLLEVPAAAAAAAVAAGAAAGVLRAGRYLRDRSAGRLSDETVVAIRRSRVEDGVETPVWRRALWYAKLALLLPLGRYPGIAGMPLRRRVALVATLAFAALYVNALTAPSDDLLGFFVVELGHSLVLAYAIGHLAMGAHEAGHYCKARLMNRLAPDVVRKVKESPIAGAFDRAVVRDEDESVRWRSDAGIWARLRWCGHIVLAAPAGKFPGVDLSLGRFAPNLTIRTTVQGEDALAIRAAGPRVDRWVFLITFPLAVLIALWTLLGLQEASSGLAASAELAAQFLFGLAVVTGLSVRVADEGAYTEYRRMDRLHARRCVELQEALSLAHETGIPDLALGDGHTIEDPRGYFRGRRADAQRFLAYVNERGAEEYLIPVQREQNTIQGGLHVDLVRKGIDLLGGYEVVIAIGNLHLQEFMVIPESDRESEKAAIASAVQLQAVRILNEYEGLMNVGQGLEGGQAVNLTYGAIRWADIPGYEWIADARYPPSDEDPHRPLYLEEMHADDDTQTREKKKLYQIPEEEAWKVLLLAIIRAGYTPGNKIVPPEVLSDKPRVWLALDGATSSLFFEYNRARGVRAASDAEIGYRLYKHPFPKELDRAQLIRIYARWLSRYPIAMIEDPFGETDLDGWKEFYEARLPDGRRVGDRYVVVGDDVVVTDEEFIRRGKREQAFNAILIKPNQIGTLSETARAIVAAYEGVISTGTYRRMAEIEARLGAAVSERDGGARAEKAAIAAAVRGLKEWLDREESQSYHVVISHRSQSPDDPIEADLALAANALAGKMGGSLNFERQSKYARLETTTDLVRRGVQMWRYRPDRERHRANGEIVIRHVYPREIFANSGTPTSRVSLLLSNGTRFCGATPVGTSAGTAEAEHGLDYVEEEFRGRGVLKAVANARTIGATFAGMSIWDKRIERLVDVDRLLLRLELEELEKCGELTELTDNALRSARACGSQEAETRIAKRVAITAQKRKRKLWMNAILPISIGFLRLLSYREGRYAWELLRQELRRIIEARIPLYQERDRIRNDLRRLLDRLEQAIRAGDRAGLEDVRGPLGSLRSRLVDYWERESFDAHSDYLYGFSDRLESVPVSANASLREYESHLLWPPTVGAVPSIGAAATDAGEEVRV